MKRFVGRRALVTGASRGIGAAVAQRLAAEGADVAIVARTNDAHPKLAGTLQQTRQLVAAHGGKVAVIVADLADPVQRAHIVEQAEDALAGSIDVLVNNAAAAIYQPLANYPLRRRHLVFEVNVHAPLDLMQAVLPGMKTRSQGWIINLSSTTARLQAGPPFDLPEPGTDMAVYAASKAALNRITNGMAAECADANIRGNTVEPAFAVLTQGAQQLVGDSLRAGQTETVEQMVEAVTFLGVCPPEFTGQITISTELIQRYGLPVHNLDATI